ncbi:spore coat protein (plasmid) [Azospirillum baldaniorum]|uniref:3-deoxy-manno-octulosonate cytidylyltransferase n=1 Tax=Azospirillum baldaniorum TaxID=1064539 RepID=A0A9P1NPT6_9PROT|nr:glycosyltransferase family protein [Azospirillum baldaniorum]AWJ91151.1 spore coat protein [Azospirillum baldaniorum]NUB06461.1 NTP transferase domain-containing protein [Azospirillum baldaniorum]TWA84013.1 spore coat polysaccharide biosynthesis protein SpsF [Azospirillum brasilense]CCD01185.1 putative 3-deoxy-manno-octulosonate cytidylyltransferase [Azospirillum baldaniorum]
MSAATAKPRVVCISQARMTSTRLPGKVLMEAAGRPLLAHHLERLARCRTLDALVLATTVNGTDDPVAELARSLGVPVFRGDEQDVLGRFAGAAAMAGADVVVRVTADCPLIDPALVDRVVAAFLESAPPLDYLSLDVTRFPRGLDSEVFTRAALDEASASATDPAEREHVTAHIYRRPERFRIGAPLAPEDGSVLDQRWCVDEAADLELVRRLLGALLPENPGFGWQDCCNLLRQHPEWADLNGSVRQNTLH